ncbi:MAG: hypothetical protein KQH79_17445 [Bacteroidetes bacterium]|nr:hypothetical protein [Bacteroidota bacterium]
MRKVVLIIVCTVLSNILFAQISITKFNGGSVTTKLGMGISVNSDSHLERDWFIINDEECPIKLNNNVGIKTSYYNSRYSLKQSGNITTKQPISAYEIHYVLYDVFGEHLKTLRSVEVAYTNGFTEISKYGSWYANENQISEYLTCIAYVAKVRTASGEIWHFNVQSIKEELNKIEIEYNESYKPNIDEDENDSGQE